MRTKDFLSVSALLAAGNAAIAPFGNDGYYNLPRYLMEDEVVTVTEYADCGTSTTYLTHTVDPTTSVPSVPGGAFITSSVGAKATSSGGDKVASGVSSAAGESGIFSDASTITVGTASVSHSTVSGPVATHSLTNDDPPTDTSDYCENGPDSRQCWGNSTIDTDFDQTWPDTGDVVEVYEIQSLLIRQY